MAAGGIHDQLGGGFHRYATDARWLVPHFEQMLYDNAQLARVYAHAWALTGDASLLRGATGVLDYMLRELATPDGGFAASQDADTEGEEGATFIWTAAEVREVLGDDAALFSAAYGVTDAGNWEGRTILSRVRADAELAERFGLSVDEVEGRLAAARSSLLAVARRAPSPPGTTRCSRPGTGSRSPRSRTPPGRWPPRASLTRSTLAGTVPRDGDPCGRRGARQPPSAGRPAPAVVARRPGLVRRRARGLRQPRGRPARPVRGDLRRALVRRPPWASSTWCSRISPTRMAASSTPPTTGSGWSSGRATSRTTRRRRAASMTATVLLRLAALTGEDRYRAAAERAIAHAGAAPRAPSDRVRAVAVRAGGRPRAIDGGRDRRRGRRRRRRGRSSSPSIAATTRSASRRRRRPRRRRRCRCSAAGSRSTAGRRRSCATASPAAFPSPSPRPSRRSLPRSLSRPSPPVRRPRGRPRRSSSCARARAARRCC